MKNILITGSSGLVGSACVELFNRKGWSVVGIDANLRSKFFGTPEKDAQLELDIRDTEEVKLLFHTVGPFDAIIHAAAQPSHDYSKDHTLEDFEVNAKGTLNLLEATRKYCPDATFIQVSTDKVYGSGMQGTTPFDEKTPFAPPFSPFGVSKLAGDVYVQEYAMQGWIKHVGIFRPGCITGKNHEGAELHGFLAYLVKCVKEGRTYKIFGDGNTVRDQIHANDLATVFLAFIEKPHALGLYNIGGGPDRAVSILEALKVASEKLGKEAKHEIYPPRFADRQWDVHDVSRFRADYPSWDYQYSLDDIFNDLCNKT